MKLLKLRKDELVENISKEFNFFDPKLRYLGGFFSQVYMVSFLMSQIHLRHFVQTEYFLYHPRQSFTQSVVGVFFHDEVHFEQSELAHAPNGHTGAI